VNPVLAALLLVTAAAVPVQASQIVLMLRLHVTDPSGQPCAGLPIVATGGAGASATTTSRAGRGLLPVVLGSRAELTRAPVMIRVKAESRSFHLESRGGAPEIMLSIGIPADDTTRLQIITNGGEVGARIADALRGAAGDTVEAALDLNCATGAGKPERDLSGRVPLPRDGIVLRTVLLPSAGPSPEPGSVDTHPGPSPPLNVPASGAPSQPPALDTRPGLSPPLRAAVPTCSCRIAGTVEVESKRPIEDRLRIAVRVKEAPAIADTVELFRGSPRPFRLVGVPCGEIRLAVTPLTRKRYRVAAPGAQRTFHCAASSRLQPRVVLVPR